VGAGDRGGRIEETADEAVTMFELARFDDADGGIEHEASSDTAAKRANALAVFLIFLLLPDL